ncbi:MAG: glycoside hydrolase family 57 protein [Candidatus Omnitrophota bacterium]|nr:glycoside hydrolase family 57 protein [Candidatus Omnitrophota bacterium]
MNKLPTKVIFIWHMHQPCYKLPNKNYYLLPWVRLHAIKDYYGMAKTVEKFDKIKVTFNFSGVLLEQLNDYITKGSRDYYVNLTLRDPGGLKKEEKDFIIDRFFSLNFERFIRPHRRYLQLYNKKLSPKARFNHQDIADLQFLFNVFWFHPYTFKEDKNLRQLLAKAKGYTAEDKEYIIDKQYEIISRIIPLYKKLIMQKKIELTLTPFHHPIMPLLYDSDIVKEFSYLKRPTLRFSYPADCVWHLQQSKDIFKQMFDYTPCGSWPSEGGVCEDVVSLYGQEGFKWIGADEANLFKSLTTEYVSYDMIKNQRHIIYRPYKFKGVNVFFRDRNFSDMLSFVYQGWNDPVFAANDLLEHFKRTHLYAKEIFKERAITIIMDGENAWEYYKNNGVDFLETLYSNLEKSDMLSTTTPSDFLQHNGTRNLERLASGSWINADFGVWIGSKKNNIYWNILRKTRDLIEKSKIFGINLEKLKSYFYLVEGSDWYWWNTFEDIHEEFKNIFFSYVEEIHRMLGKKPPARIK